MLNYKIIGQGKPVVFLHGFLESISMWSDLELHELNFQAILVDLPGHGASKNEDNSTVPSIDFMAIEVLKLIDYLNLKTIDVVGHSMGGYVALTIKQINKNCNKIVLLNSNFWEDTPEKIKDRIRVADIVFKNKNLFLKEAIPNLYNDRLKYNSQISSLLEEAMRMDSFSIAYASLAMSKRKNLKELLVNSPEDFCIIQGELDQIVPSSKMKEELDGLGVDCNVVYGVGHMSHFENSSEVGKLINDFINS